MSRCREPITPMLLLLAWTVVPSGGAAQADPWAAPVRGSWVRTGPAAGGDVVLASRGSGAEIVVSAAENLNVRQAAAFLANDIETISGYRPPIVATPTAGRTSIRLATVGNGPFPAAIDAKTLLGQWESYRVVTAPWTVWLVNLEMESRPSPRGLNRGTGEHRQRRVATRMTPWPWSNPQRAAAATPSTWRMNSTFVRGRVRSVSTPPSRDSSR